MVPRLIGRFDRLLTVSQNGARELAQRYGLRFPDVIRPPTPELQPVPPGSARRAQREQVGLPRGFLLGLVGRVQLRQKGHDVALRVFAELARRHPEVQLVVIGDGPDLPRVQGQAGKLGLGSRVSFLGWRPDVGSLIPLLDLVLLPSHFEGLPQTALQASTARVPVVAYAVDGLPELLPAEFLVKHGDEAALARLVRAVYQGELAWPAQAMAQRAAAWGNPETAAEQLLALASRAASAGAIR